MEIAKVLGSVADQEGHLRVGLPRHRLTVGESVDVIVEFVPGVEPWVVDEIELTLAVPYRSDDGFQVAPVHREELVADLTVDAVLAETHTTSVSVPRNCPEPLGGVDVVGRLAVETDRGRDTEVSHLDVNVPVLQAVFEAVIDRGLTPTGIDCVAATGAENPPYVQQITFEAVDSPARTRVEVLELYYRPADTSAEVWARTGAAGTVPVPSGDGDLGSASLDATDPTAAREWARGLVA